MSRDRQAVREKRTWRLFALFSFPGKVEVGGWVVCLFLFCLFVLSGD